MAKQSDPLASLEALAAQFKEKEKSVRDALEAMAEKLSVICAGTSIFVTSGDKTFEEYSPEEHYYGRLSFDGTKFRVSYRSTEDDLHDAHTGPDPYGPRYEVKSLEECPGEWLRVLLKNQAVQDLLPQIGEQIAERLRATTEIAEQIDQILANPQTAIASSFEHAARALGYDQIVRNWKDAQAKVHTDPDAAITQASSLVESICKHVIHDANEPLPANQDIQHLFKAASKCVQLDPDSQANADLTGLCRGLATVAQCVGALRTHFGSAHGRGPAQSALATSHAQLAVSAAGSISAFLMERWHELKPPKK